MKHLNTQKLRILPFSSKSSFTWSRT